MRKQFSINFCYLSLFLAFLVFIVYEFTKCQIHSTPRFSLFNQKIDRHCYDVRTIGDGGGLTKQGYTQLPYRVCFDAKAAPIKENCTVLSFGVPDNWSFEDDMAQRVGCEVYAFDPSLSLSEHTRPSGVYFSPLAIAPVNGVLKAESFRRIFEILSSTELGNRSIDVLKIDVQHPASEIFTDKDSLRLLKLRVKQLVIKWQWRTNLITQSAYDNIRSIAGFQAFYVQPTNGNQPEFSVEALINPLLSPPIILPKRFLLQL